MCGNSFPSSVTTCELGEVGWIGRFGCVSLLFLRSEWSERAESGSVVHETHRLMLSIPTARAIDVGTIDMVGVTVIDLAQITKANPVGIAEVESVGIMEIDVVRLGGPAIVNIGEIDVISVEKTKVFRASSIKDLSGDSGEDCLHKLDVPRMR